MAGFIQSMIDTQAKLELSSGLFEQEKTTRFGPQTVLPASATIPARLRPDDPGSHPKSSLVVVGEVPEGFGNWVQWSPEDAGLALLAFVAAGDLGGIMIQGVKATDTIEFVSADGIASFSEETNNGGVASFIGILEAGANVAASSFGAPELAPVISAAAEFAKSRYREEKVKTKRRDPFGVDPGTGHKARQEGGVLVCLPEARGAYYSGNGDHKERWIQEPGTRDLAHRPAHVEHGFFLERNSSNQYTASLDGSIFIVPWDHKFEDNFGSYRLQILLRRGTGQIPNPI